METIDKVNCRSKSVEITYIHSQIFEYKIKSNLHLKWTLKERPCIQVRFFSRHNCAETTQRLSRFSPKIVEAQLKESFM